MIPRLLLPINKKSKKHSPLALDTVGLEETITLVGEYQSRGTLFSVLIVLPISSDLHYSF